MAKPKRDDWWFSSDGKRGLCWDNVVAYDYRPASPNGQSTLYAYTGGGIVCLHGSEADSVYQVLAARKPKSS